MIRVTGGTRGLAPSTLAMALVGVTVRGSGGVPAGSIPRASAADVLDVVCDSPLVSIATGGGGLAKSLAATASPGRTCKTRGRSTLLVPPTPAGFCEGPSKASAQAPPAAKVNRVGHQPRLGATYMYGETRADPSKDGNQRRMSDIRYSLPPHPRSSKPQYQKRNARII